MPHTQVYRAKGSRVLGAGTVGFAAVLLVWLGIGSPGRLLVLGPALLLLASLGWLAYWRPCVVIDEQGIVLHNVFRRVVVPWPALVEVHSRYGMRVETTGGTFGAWAVPAPTGLGRAQGGDTEATTMVRQRLARLQAHGEVPPADATTAPRTQVDRTAVAVAGVLTALTVLGLLATLP